MTKKEFNLRNPVMQAFHSGGWGFERVYDYLNLNRCVYATRRAAELARSRAYSEGYSADTDAACNGCKNGNCRVHAIAAGA